MKEKESTCLGSECASGLQVSQGYVDALGADPCLYWHQLACADLFIFVLCLSLFIFLPRTESDNIHCLVLFPLSLSLPLCLSVVQGMEP